MSKCDEVEVSRLVRERFQEAADELSDWQVTRNDFGRYAMHHPSGFYLHDHLHAWLSGEIVLSFWKENDKRLIDKVWSVVEERERQERCQRLLAAITKKQAPMRRAWWKFW